MGSCSSSGSLVAPSSSAGTSRAQGGPQGGPTGTDSAGKGGSLGSLGAFTSPRPLLDMLHAGDVRLLRPKWMVDRFFRSSEPLPRRQEVPEDAFLSTEELGRCAGSSPIVIVVSYCWLSKGHPDPGPARYHLETLAHMLQIFCDSSFDTADDVYMPGRKEDLKSRGACFGPDVERPVGVFIDWTALYQEPRSPSQQSVFKRALKGINAWYGHSETIVWKLTSLPPGTPRPDYDASGWTTFEQQVARMITPDMSLLHIDDQMRQRVVSPNKFRYRNMMGRLDFIKLVLEAADTKRGAPMTPEKFGRLVDEKTFTNGADRDAIVKPRYTETFEAVISDAEVLKFSDLKMESREVEQLFTVIGQHSRKVRDIDISRNGISSRLEELVHALERSACEKLHSLNMAYNKISGQVADLASLVNLVELCLSYTNVQGDIAGLAPLVNLMRLDLHSSKVQGNLAGLAALVNITMLDLSITNVQGDVASLSPLANLTELRLFGTKVQGTVAGLAPLVNLAKLVLSCTEVRGNVAGLAPLVNLVHLDLQNNKSLQGNVAGLAPLTNLRDLLLYDTSVQGDVASLAPLANLTRLDLDDTQVQGDVAGLSALAHLTDLRLRCTAVKGHVAALAPLVSLRHLDLLGTAVQGYHYGWLPGDAHLGSAAPCAAAAAIATQRFSERLAQAAVLPSEPTQSPDLKGRPSLRRQPPHGCPEREPVLGEIRQPGGLQTPYCIVGRQAAASDAYESIVCHPEVWSLRHPNVLLSIVGGAGHFSIDPSVEDGFPQGVARAAKQTRAWLTSGGTNAGVMVMVSEALAVNDKRRTVPLIGITSLGCLKSAWRNRLDADPPKDENHWIRRVDPPMPDELCQEGEEYLPAPDEHHTHLICIDSGQQGTAAFGAEAAFRAEFEAFLEMPGALKAQPLDGGRTGMERAGTVKVLIVVGGGPVSLGAIHNNLEHCSPVIIMRGSGRLCDLIAHIKDHPDVAWEDAWKLHMTSKADANQLHPQGKDMLSRIVNSNCLLVCRSADRLEDVVTAAILQSLQAK